MIMNTNRKERGLLMGTILTCSWSDWGKERSFSFRIFCFGRDL